jgi:DNA-binding transcriptional ArsR family regulator
MVTTRGGVSARERAAREALALFEGDFFKALAEPTRLDVLRVLLAHGPCDVAAIATHMPQDRSVLSRHLQILLRADLVSCRREGRHRVYAVRGQAFVERLERLLATLRRVVPACCP